ncbi:protein of unknown function [Taphrina deformans PYCC 5710]|uniref:HAD superfamily hydrolase n=1 Tax=Taphrina deformans (strain PYCC 5710 / ATCC 11124 / CBS 356.35 / IMI 108563 / JCM 9778 / NBRC 8474) TaxID=1097556 RepID=R4XF01_TAPDE|nr:protein of unknown function [Taphrina deformans PYCC 5710]|eukprot:CCG84361.1 protein of unknown function [Taphrina deformans PYCC 5710]
MSSSRPTLKALIFDMDGTLTKPQNYMFQEMRRALGIKKSQDILGSIEELPDSQQDKAHEKIRDIERKAMSDMAPQDGLSPLMKYLDTTTLFRGICTRNFHEPTQYLLRTYLRDHQISPVLTREFTPAKPSPRPLEHICAAWNIRPSECIMVGDGVDDLVSAKAAGMDSILLQNEENKHLVDSHEPSYVVHDLSEIISIVKQRTGCS